MLGKKSPEVLVIGAGPVGLMAALVLAKQEIRVEIIDKQWRTGGRSYALALHTRSLQLLEELGLLDRLLAKAYKVDRIGLYDETAQRAKKLSPPHSIHSWEMYLKRRCQAQRSEFQVDLELP